MDGEQQQALAEIQQTQAAIQQSLRNLLTNMEELRADLTRSMAAQNAEITAAQKKTPGIRSSSRNTPFAWPEWRRGSMPYKNK